MTSRMFRSVVSGFLIVVSIAVAWKAAVRRSQLEGSLTELNQDQINLEAQTAKAEARRVIIARDAPKPVQKGGLDKAMLVEKAARNDQKMQALWMKSDRAGMYFRYAAFYHALGLTPAQVAKFERVMAEHFQNDRDIKAAANEEGILSSDPAITQLQSQEQSRFNSALTDALGPDGPHQLLDFDDGSPGALGSSSPTRQMVDRLTAVLADSANPITPQQAQQLVNLLKASQVPSPTDPTGSQIDWNNAGAKAAEILSPAQMVEFGSAAALTDRYQTLTQLMDMYRKWYNSLSAASRP